MNIIWHYVTYEYLKEAENNYKNKREFRIHISQMLGTY